MTALPTLEELLALRGAASGLTIGGRARSRMSQQGAHGSVQRGRGLEFQEVRAYVPGDDPRTIDWRVTARRGRVHTKLFREERERQVWLLVDLQPGLFFGSRRQLKSALAVRAATLLAWVAVLAGDRIGAVIVGGAPGARILPPRSRDRGVLPLLEALLQTQPTRPGTPAPQRLAEAVQALSPLVRPGSRILALSDFAGLNSQSETAWTAAWSALSAHSDCWFLWITDALEERALPNGQFRVGLPGRLQLLDGAAVRSRWLSSWHERETRLQALSRRIAAALVRLDTQASVQEALRPLLQAKRSAA